MSRCQTRSVLTLLAALLVAPVTLADDPPEVRWEPYETMGVDGKPLVGELGRITVPENRAAGTDATIEIAFVRFATENPDPGPPIVFLAGGPGGSGITGCVGPATGRRARLLDHCDVIGVDQRGTGLSVPNLFEGPDTSYVLPFDEPLSKRAVIEADRDAIEECVAYWRGEGVDLEAYNTEESADDIDDVRRALGLETIQPFGSSYGSHLGLAYLRRHGEHVARAVLSKVEGPDHTWKLPSQIQAQVDRVHDLVTAHPRAGEALPDLRSTLRDLIAQLDEEPVTVRVTDESGDTHDVVCGGYDLQRVVGSFLADRVRVENLPMFLVTTAQGDHQFFGELAYQNRFAPSVSAMTLMMDCSSGGTSDRMRRIAREARRAENLLGDSFDGYYSAICRACGDPDLGDAFRGPIDCDAPVLFVSGTLDARTPPSNVEELIDGFPNAVHVVVDGVGHPARELLLPEYCALLLDFVSGGDVESTELSLPPMRFAGFD